MEDTMLKPDRYQFIPRLEKRHIPSVVAWIVVVISAALIGSCAAPAVPSARPIESAANPTGLAATPQASQPAPTPQLQPSSSSPSHGAQAAPSSTPPIEATTQAENGQVSFGSGPKFQVVDPSGRRAVQFA